MPVSTFSNAIFLRHLLLFEEIRFNSIAKKSRKFELFGQFWLLLDLIAVF